MSPASPEQSPVQALEDRRVAPRFQPAFHTVYRFLEGNNDDPRVGLVWNISRTGISMLLADPPERGHEVIGELSSDTNAAAIFVAMRIVHVRPLSTGDYLLGAQFSRPLEQEEMQSFLNPPPGERIDNAD